MTFPLRSALRSLLALVVLALAFSAFTFPGIALIRDLADPAISGPGIPARAVSLHRDLTPRITTWARERVASGRAAEAPLHDVAITEWPMFTAVFYLMATAEMQAAWDRGDRSLPEPPMPRAADAVQAARDLILDPAHHTWVRTHWGDGYMHRENVFFRSLVIAGLTSHEAITRDGTSLPVLRDQVETLSRDLDRSPLGLLHDYPDECYPIDVLAAVGIIRRADAVLGTDHRAFAARARRAFEGRHADAVGLPRYRVRLPDGAEIEPSRGIGNSWSFLFIPELWPDHTPAWYARYEAVFWRDHGWAAGFREYAPHTDKEEWTFDIDAGPVLDGLGTAASAFGLAAARRNGRFDQAYTLAAQISAASWTLPGGTLLFPRIFSHAADAPYLGEAAILYFFTVQPAAGMPVRSGGFLAGLPYLGFAVYGGGTLLGVSIALWLVRKEIRRLRERWAARRRAEG